MLSLFVTGCTGFIGSRLLEKMDTTKFHRVYCLYRPGQRAQSMADHVEPIEGDLLNPNTFDAVLASCDTVVHLAAATGQARREDCFKVNSEGTWNLLEHCKRKGVKNFLYVSTIAVKYPERSHYYYAQSKELAEQYVKESPLSYTIVRPTIVIGRQGSVWNALLRLASKPVLVIPGNGSVMVQPIYIDDLIDCLLDILHRNFFDNQTVELGGPEAISFEQFLLKVQKLSSGKNTLKIHIPVQSLMVTLSLLEKMFFSKLPVTAGQLNAFCNDSTIEINKTNVDWISQMKSVEGMLREVISRV